MSNTYSYSYDAPSTRTTDKTPASPETQNYNTLLFTQNGASVLQDFIQTTKIGTRQWLLQGSSETRIMSGDGGLERGDGAGPRGRGVGRGGEIYGEFHLSLLLPFQFPFLLLRLRGTMKHQIDRIWTRTRQKRRTLPTCKMRDGRGSGPGALDISAAP